MARQHEVPLSDQAVAISARSGSRTRSQPACVRRTAATPAAEPHVDGHDFEAARGVGVTVHGMRSSARSWMADTGVPFELAEACLAHQVGNAVVQAYQRSSMLERRRPVLTAWATFVTGPTGEQRDQASHGPEE